MSYRTVKGDLIALAQQGEFDVIAHGCNCLCTMGAGIAPQIAKAFGADRYDLERPEHKGDVNKLGQIEWNYVGVKNGTQYLAVVNAYTQYSYGRNHKDGVKNPLDYEALTLCLRKINITFAEKKIGLPMIGAGLAGGDWDRIETIIKKELFNCETTVVIYNK